MNENENEYDDHVHHRDQYHVREYVNPSGPCADFTFQCLPLRHVHVHHQCGNDHVLHANYYT